MTHRMVSSLVLMVLVAGLPFLVGGCDLFKARVDFMATPRAGEPPLEVAFTALVQGAATGWLWDFGDGATSAEQNPVHTYQDTGAYSVTLTVESRWGSTTSTTKTDYIVPIRHDEVPAPVFITYVNNSLNPDQPDVFVFVKNAIPTFDTMRDGIAWRVLPNIGKGSSSEFIFPRIGTVQATWGDGNITTSLPAKAGARYAVQEDPTGLVLLPNGTASQTTAVEVNLQAQVDGGIVAQLMRDGLLLLQKHVATYGQKATFVVQPKLYWGIASEIQEGQSLSTAVLETDLFFEQDLEGVSQATVTLTGNPKDGYQFEVDSD